MQISNNFLKAFASLLIVLTLFSCKEELLPKPNGFLALAYPNPVYQSYHLDSCKYSFEKNNMAQVVNATGCSVVINYPALDGALYLTYKNVNGDIKQLLTDAQKLTYEHVIKADEILEEAYVNEKHKVYGMFYDVSGNAASQSQFYVTDSVSHFLTGSIYFNVKPNFDSILPAAAYLKNDIRYLMESLQWEE